MTTERCLLCGEAATHQAVPLVLTRVGDDLAWVRADTPDYFCDACKPEKARPLPQGES